MWYDLRSRQKLVIDSVDDRDHLCLALGIHRPEAAGRPSMLGIVKVLVDGAISALHSHDGTQPDVAAARLSVRLGVPADEVAGPLTANPAGCWASAGCCGPSGTSSSGTRLNALVDLGVVASPSQTWQVSGVLLDLGSMATAAA